MAESHAWNTDNAASVEHATNRHLDETPTPKGVSLVEEIPENVGLDVFENESLLQPEESVHSSSVPRGGVPLLAWPLLAASLVAVSSAAVVFASMKDVPTFALAAWRLQLTTFLLSPAAVYQYSKLPQGDDQSLSLPITMHNPTIRKYGQL